MEDLALNNLVEELEHLRPTARLLEWSLKNSGFKLIDRVGKETVLTGALNKYKGLAKTVKGREKIVSRYGPAFTDKELQGVIKSLQKGEVTPDVKLLLWHELTRVQPIALSEMPAWYLNHPKGRIFYMLKTFTLKQLDLLRREAYEEIKKGNVAKGAYNLTRHAAILGLANGSVENVKAWLRGEDVEWGDLVIANMYRNYGMSEYTMKKIKQGRPIEAFVDIALPPTQVGDDLYQAITTLDYTKGLDYIPPYGKAINEMFELEED
jgi:hypothetical protein